MEIRILGPGCPRCREVERRVKDALEELDVAADIEKITDIDMMMSYGILATPGLVINGKVKCAGRIPRPKEIEAWIREAAA
jgi:small redox-active disulfide protein 2